MEGFEYSRDQWVLCCLRHQHPVGELSSGGIRLELNEDLDRGGSQMKATRAPSRSQELVFECLVVEPWILRLGRRKSEK